MAGRKRARAIAAERAAVAPPKHQFGPEAMAVVVEALRRGATVKAAAREAGFGESCVHDWRKKAPHFDAACLAALETRGPLLVTASGGREWLLRRPRRNAFSRRRKEIYLDHFAATCDSRAAAAAAGVSKSTVDNHRRTDPVFAEACQEALRQSYAELEAEAVRQRLAAMEKFRVVADETAAGELERMVADEFERTLGLLREHKRNLAGKPHQGRPPTRWSFAEAMVALEKRLKVFGIRIEEDGDAGQGADDEDA